MKMYTSMHLGTYTSGIKLPSLYLQEMEADCRGLQEAGLQPLIDLVQGEVD